jgi:hypothetical protein
VRNFHVLSAGCSPVAWVYFREALGKNCNFRLTKFPAVIFFLFLVIKTLELKLDPDPHWDLDPDPQLEKMLDPQPWRGAENKSLSRDRRLYKKIVSYARPPSL